jgi:hypothetical protein
VRSRAPVEASGAREPSGYTARVWPLLAWLALLVWIVPLRGAGAEGAPPLLDLSGEWYVIVHYRDGRGPEAEGVHFRDFAWSIEQGERELLVRSYPYVVFDDELEEVRKAYMRAAESWDPDPATLARLRRELTVSPRAATRERLVGSREAGFRSPPSTAGAGANTLTFTRDWSVSFDPGRVRVQIDDALGGSAGLEEMRETALYEIRDRIDPGELRGVYREGALEGTFRMLRSRERRVVD